MERVKRRGSHLHFPLMIFMVSMLFTFLIWDHFFHSDSPVDQTLVSHLILIMGTLFSVSSGFFAYSVEKHKAQLEAEVGRRTAQLKKRNRTLEAALQEIRVLRGFVPICVTCKKIRNDEGFWEQVEDYIQRHTDATLTHGMCRECMHSHYPAMATRRDKQAS